ncbi:MAG: LysR family transcriptional regulator [Myxococcota bacterium]|jgi:DNA-binding transcriptional LysR family regulator|nr:LysR family transcriptional regulator [Myxococcota bacterium]
MIERAAPALDEIRAFVAVYESGAFVAAGRRLGVTTNAISLRVRKLESALGVPLFVRTTRHVAATEEGHRYYTLVRGPLEGLDAAADGLANVARATVHLAIPSALVDAFVERLAAEDLEVHVRVTDRFADPAKAGLDVSVHVGPPPDSDHVARRLGSTRWVLAATAGYLERRGRPRSPEELAAHACLRFASPSVETSWVLRDRRGRETVAALGSGFVCDDSRTLALACDRGLGIGVRSSADVRTHRLERVLPRWSLPPLEVFAVTPRGRARLRRVARCLDVLSECVGALDA